MRKIVVLVIFMLSLEVANGTTPYLFFSKSDIPSLKAKAKSVEFRDEWKAYVAKADDFCNPKSPSYADPAKATVGYDEIALDYVTNVDCRGCYCGRRLADYMQNLGLVYHLTGKKKCRDQGVELLVSYAEALPVDHPFMVKGFDGCKADLVRGLIIGYDMFGEFLTHQQKEIFFKTSKGYLDDFITRAEKFSTLWRPYHNYSGVYGGAAGCIALQLKDYDKKLSESYVQRVMYVLKDWMWKGFDQRGAYLEGTAYSVYGLEPVVFFAAGLKREGGEDLFKHPALRNLINFYVMTALPGEKVMDARNDTDYDKPGAILLKLADEYKNGLCQWMYSPTDLQSIFLRLIWSNDVKPVSPIEAGMPLAEHFEQRGLCVWRTGWDKNDVMFSIESGQFYPITHNQADKGQFTLYGFGYRWACDAGYGCNQEPNGRCQTVAHNCILIDGKGQSISGAGLGNNGKILVYDNNDAYGYALADTTEAYRQNIVLYEEKRIFHYGGESVHNMDLDHAYRHTFFVRKTAQNPAYAVVLDDIVKDKVEHEYCWQMLTWPDLKINLTDPNMTVLSPSSSDGGRSPKLFAFIDAESPVILKQEDYNVGPLIFSAYPMLSGSPPSYPRLRAYCKAVNPYFAAVLIPTDGSINPPKVKFDKSSSEETIRIEWPGKTDTIVWKKDGKSRPQMIVSSK